MVYKNLIYRVFVSLIFIFLYIFLSYLNFEYIFFIIILIYCLILVEVFIFFIKYRLVIFIYLLITSTSLLHIDFVEKNFVKFNLFILIIICFDIFSYFIGNLLGKNKLFTKISPNKTFEGLFGGIIFSLLISIIYSYYFNILITLNLLLFIISIITASFIGDIIESKFKRLNKLKNSSNLLPGHGGFFDRFDSFVLSLLVYSFMSNII